MRSGLFLAAILLVLPSCAYLPLPPNSHNYQITVGGSGSSGSWTLNVTTESSSKDYNGTTTQTIDVGSAKQLGVTLTRSEVSILYTPSMTISKDGLQMTTQSFDYTSSNKSITVVYPWGN